MTIECDNPITALHIAIVKLRELAGECAGCDGRGVNSCTFVSPGSRPGSGNSITRDEPCTDCEDIREVLVAIQPYDEIVDDPAAT